jgi:hypothetical protein
MSEHPFDALRYAPGPLLHRVELGGDMKSHGDPVDKCAGSRRKILATIDATNLLRTFARRCALDVIHLWDAPQIVREYLETGDETKRAAARDATRDATWDAAQSAASSATWDAAQSAARAAAIYAASAVVIYAAWAAARDAQRTRLAEMVELAFKSKEVGSESMD